ncbi:MAG: hypothetical protein B0D91_12190 [Oceanospirillales bacterium LUC14_002_19_P2]|nr:MAG: hypothetical protein B0D91_12190 [Oceanospirillales bacterium LUC14_002_19_P2]
MPAIVRIAIAIVLLASSLPARLIAADPASLEDAITLQKDTLQRSAQSQQAINHLDDENRRMLSEYQSLQAAIDTLREENHHLDNQRQKIAQKRATLEADIQKTTQLLATLPSLNQQIHETYGRFIGLDLPFQGNRREQEHRFLGELLNDADQTPVENYLALVRQLRETAEQGLHIQHWTGKLSDERQVTFLRLGHIALYYLTPDGEEGAIWDRSTETWSTLPMEDRHKLSRAIRVAAKQEPTGWLVLPLPTHRSQPEGDV